jgi:hypothetical protein
MRTKAVRRGITIKTSLQIDDQKISINNNYNDVNTHPFKWNLLSS